ncbi:MAG: Crp/Fnr family transcriptional regulator [Nitrospiraceae bacterium]|nr:Crp/Fnr family transcriptional regulator [Nitrospiraceae bacterium]
MENIKIEFLKDIELFSSLTDDELLEISHKVVVKEFSKNELILQEEETNAFMYIILLGKVKAVQTTEEGKEIILAIHQAQEFFGEISLIDGKTSTAAVVATEESLVAIISKDNFYSLLYSQRKVLENLLRILCSRLRESWNRIHILNFRDAPQRIRMLLKILVSENGEKTADGVKINLKLTHQEIADMAGLTRESVTRVLNDWKREGLIVIARSRHIVLRDRFFQKA